MTLRMIDYAHGLFQRYPEREVYGLVVNTGSRPFGPWWCPVQAVACTRGYGFQPGPVLDVHDFPLPVFPDARYPLSPDSLMTGFIALARQPFPVGGPVGMCYNLSAPTLLATTPLDPGHQVLPCPATPLMTASPA